MSGANEPVAVAKVIAVSVEVELTDGRYWKLGWIEGIGRYQEGHQEGEPFRSGYIPPEILRGHIDAALAPFVEADLA